MFGAGVAGVAEASDGSFDAGALNSSGGVGAGFAEALSQHCPNGHDFAANGASQKIERHAGSRFWGTEGYPLWGPGRPQC